jgi:hypothetical protein
VIQLSFKDQCRTKITVKKRNWRRRRLRLRQFLQDKLGNPPSTRRSYHHDGESTSSDEESDRLARTFAFHEDQLSPQLVSYLSGTLSASDYLHQIVLLSQQGARSRKALMQAVALICDTYGHVYALVPQATPAKPSLIRGIYFMIASPQFPRGTAYSRTSNTWMMSVLAQSPPYPKPRAARVRLAALKQPNLSSKTLVL